MSERSSIKQNPGKPRRKRTSGDAKKKSHSKVSIRGRQAHGKIPVEPDVFEECCKEAIDISGKGRYSHQAIAYLLKEKTGHSVATSTISRWLTEGDELYRPELAQAAELALGYNSALAVRCLHKAMDAGKVEAVKVLSEIMSSQRAPAEVPALTFSVSGGTVIAPSGSDIVSAINRAQCKEEEGQDD